MADEAGAVSPAGESGRIGPGHEGPRQRLSRRLTPIERQAAAVLRQAGYRVMPARSCHPGRHAVVNLLGMRDRTEFLYLKLVSAVRSRTDGSAARQACREGARRLRQYYPSDPGEFVLRLQVWLLQAGDLFARFEVRGDDLAEAGHACV